MSPGGCSGSVTTPIRTFGASAVRRPVRSAAAAVASVAHTVSQRGARAAASSPVPQAVSQAVRYRGRVRQASTMPALRRSYQLVATRNGSGSPR
ncbi:MAG TPA: hypothetical protein VES01_02510 [Dermatophilaceae bacterium]|nr:hypothetical protein [Dermatophilaceae bacterium]